MFAAQPNKIAVWRSTSYPVVICWDLSGRTGEVGASLTVRWPDGLTGSHWIYETQRLNPVNSPSPGQQCR